MDIFSTFGIHRHHLTIQDDCCFVVGVDDSVYNKALTENPNSLGDYKYATLVDKSDYVRYPCITAEIVNGVVKDTKHMYKYGYDTRSGDITIFDPKDVTYNVLVKEQQSVELVDEHTNNVFFNNEGIHAASPAKYVLLVDESPPKEIGYIGGKLNEAVFTINKNSWVSIKVDLDGELSTEGLPSDFKLVSRCIVGMSSRSTEFTFKLKSDLGTVVPVTIKIPNLERIG